VGHGSGSSGMGQGMYSSHVTSGSGQFTMGAGQWKPGAGQFTKTPGQFTSGASQVTRAGSHCTTGSGQTTSGSGHQTSGSGQVSLGGGHTVYSGGQITIGAGQIIGSGWQTIGSSHFNSCLHSSTGSGHFPPLHGGFVVVQTGTVVQVLLVVVQGFGVVTSQGGWYMVHSSLVVTQSSVSMVQGNLLIMQSLVSTLHGSWMTWQIGFSIVQLLQDAEHSGRSCVQGLLSVILQSAVVVEH